MPFVDLDLVVRRVDDRNWSLIQSLTYVGKSERFVIPAGFH